MRTKNELKLENIDLKNTSKALPKQRLLIWGKASEQNLWLDKLNNQNASGLSWNTRMCDQLFEQQECLEKIGFDLSLAKI